MEEFLAAPAYRKVRRVSTGGVEWRVGKLLKALGWSEEVQRFLIPHGTRAPRMYGLPMLPKVGVSLRPRNPDLPSSLISGGPVRPVGGQCNCYIKH